MGTLRAQFSEAFRRLEEALDAIYSLTERIREEIGGETSVPAIRSKEELLARLFPEGLPTERLRGELERSRARYQEKKASVQAEIEEVLAKLHQLEAEYDSIEKKCQRIEEIYQDLFGETNAEVSAGEALPGVERAS